MTNKVYAICTYPIFGDSVCLMLVNAPDGETAVKLARELTNVEDVRTGQIQYDEVVGVVCDTDIECVIKVFDDSIEIL